MDNLGFQLALVSFLAAALAYGALGVRLSRRGYLGRRAGPPAARFWIAIALSATWGLGGAAVMLWPDQLSATLVSGLDLARTAAWFAFLWSVLQPSDDLQATGARSAVAARGMGGMALFLVLAGAAGWLASLVWDSPGVQRVGLLISMAQPVFGLLLLEQLFRNLRPDGRWGAKPLCLGLGGIFAFDLYIYSQAVLFGQFDADAFAVRAGVHTLAVPLLLMAARRQAEWQARLQVSHRAAFYSATLLLAGAYLLFMSAIGYYVRFFGGDWGRALQLALLFGGLVFLGLLLLSGALRAKLRVLISKNFFAYRYDYREQWLRFTLMLSTPSSPQEMGALVIGGLADMVESPGGCLWTVSTDGQTLVQTAHTKSLVTPAPEPVDGAFVNFLREQAWIIDVDEARRHGDRYKDLVLPGWLAADDDVWAVVPLLVGDSLTGFVLLAHPRTSTDLDWEVRDLLKTAARQAAAFLAQLHAAEALLEVRKFDAFNRMSAFVVHDLKNIVTQLSLMLKNAKRLQHNPEFQNDMLMTVESSLDKMRQLMLQLRDGEAPSSATLGVELSPIARRLADAAAQHGRALELRHLDAVATRGHADRIERVLGHLVQNAFDATPADGQVWIELRRVSGQAQVVVGDTGQGMSSEFIQDRLFKPFSSTKRSGMGIGAYESAQYVRELGGQIQVTSRPDRGTVITVVLPLFELPQGSDLQTTVVS